MCKLFYLHLEYSSAASVQPSKLSSHTNFRLYLLHCIHESPPCSSSGPAACLFQPQHPSADTFTVSLPLDKPSQSVSSSLLSLTVPLTSPLSILSNPTQRGAQHFNLCDLQLCSVFSSVPLSLNHTMPLPSPLFSASFLRFFRCLFIAHHVPWTCHKPLLSSPLPVALDHWPSVPQNAAFLN